MALLPRKPAKHPAKPKRGKKLEVEEPGVLYGRYSSHNQKDISVEQQFEKGYELAAEYGIRIIDTYADRAVSGRTDKRRDFQRMMTDAAKGKFRYVIAWKSNRMGRNMLEALINEARLQDLGVRVLYVEEDFDDTAAGRFAARSMMNVNQFYSENMAEDIKRGLYDNAANCMVANGHLPYGYKADETLHYAIDEPKAAVIREIFTRVSCGEAFVDIMASLNARGIKTSYGRPWGRSSFQKILSNERYRGIYIYGDVRKEGGIPRIISDELYFKVQEVITTKKNPQGRHRVNGDYLLTGKLFCGHCKSPMTGISGTSRSGNLHYYYVCQKRRTEKTCEKKNLRRDDIELQVAKAIKRRTLDDDTINWIADSVVEYSQHQESASGIGLLEDQLKDTQRSIKNLMAAIEQGIITPTTKARLMELEKEQSDIDRKITMAKADVIPVNRDQLVGWLKKLQAGDVHDKKYQAELFDTFLIAVYVYDNPDGQDYMKVVFNYAGSKNTVEIPLDPSVIDNVENIETGAVRLSSAQVHQAAANSVCGSFFLFLRIQALFSVCCKPCVFFSICRCSRRAQFCKFFVGDGLRKNLRRRAPLRQKTVSQHCTCFRLLRTCAIHSPPRAAALPGLFFCSAALKQQQPGLMAAKRLVLRLRLFPEAPVCFAVFCRQTRNIFLQCVHDFRKPRNGSVESHQRTDDRCQKAHKRRNHGNNRPFAHVSSSSLVDFKRFPRSCPLLRVAPA